MKIPDEEGGKDNFDNWRRHAILPTKNISKKLRKQFQCDFCGNYYNNSEPLKTHIEIMHKGLYEIRQFENKNVIKCKDCDSIFTGIKMRQCESNLKIHIRSVHEGERNFSCNMCEKAFWHPFGLKRHINCVHYKKKYASCNNCGKSFSEPAYLKKHKCRIHKCDFCEKVCTEKTFLRHIEKCQKKKVVKKSWCATEEEL